MKKPLSLLLVLCILFAFAACSWEEPATITDGGKGSASPSVVGYITSEGFDISKYDGVPLEIMWQETDNTQIDIVTNYAQAAVAEAFPNVDIEWVGKSETDYTTLVQTGDLADVWFGNTSMEMIDSGAILNLTDYLTADTYLDDNFSNPDFFYFRDHIWALGTGVDNFYTGTLYYNQDIFDRVGITSIATYDELYAACQKLMSAGYIPITLDGNNNSVFTRFLFQNLIISVDPQNYLSILDGGDLYTDSTAQAMQLIVDMKDAGFLGTGTGVKSTSESISSFVEEKAAILYTDSWNNGYVDAASPLFKVTVAWWPSANDEYATGEYLANWGSPLSGWTANADTEYPELAVEVIKCIVKAEAARHLDVGLTTNFIQDGTPVPANELEKQRAALYAEVGTWYKGFWQNALDSQTATEIGNQCATLMSDDGYKVVDFLIAIQTAWNANTFFG